MGDVYIVTAERLRLRDKPSGEARVLRYLVRGETVDVLEKAPGDGWWRVRLRGALTGASEGWTAAYWLRARDPEPLNLDAAAIVQRLKRFCPRGAKALLEGVAAPLAENLPAAGIDTPIRLQHFFAQSAYETDQFSSFMEGHGRLSDDYFREYCDPAGPLGSALGNTEPGDGPRYKGRGMLLLAGRAAYAAAGEALGLDLVNHPELAERPENAVRTALWLWNVRDASEAADKDDLEAVTRQLRRNAGGDLGPTMERRRRLLDSARKIWR